MGTLLHMTKGNPTMFHKRLLSLAIAAPLMGCMALPSIATAGDDVGLKFEKYIASQTNKLFGFRKPLAESADSSVARSADMTPTTLPQNSVTSFGRDASSQLDLARGLEATYLTRVAADWTDMMDFWDENGDGEADHLRRATRPEPRHRRHRHPAAFGAAH